MNLQHLPIPFTLFAIGMAMMLAVLGSRAGRKSAPVLIAKQFLSGREQAMLNVLEQVLPDHRVHAQVAMGALIKVKLQKSPADRNAFAQKIVDFVVQSRATGEIVALIEVDDASHRAERDSARDRMTAQAGYRTIRIPAKTKPAPQEVRAELAWLTQPEMAGFHDSDPS